jgi:hypothetical protein
MKKIQPWNYLYDYVYEHYDYLIYPIKKDNKSIPEFYQVYSPEGELLNQQFEYASDWGTSDVKITSIAQLNDKVFDLSSAYGCQIYIDAHYKQNHE